MLTSLRDLEGHSTNEVKNRKRKKRKEEKEKEKEKEPSSQWSFELRSFDNVVQDVTTTT